MLLDKSIHIDAPAQRVFGLLSPAAVFDGVAHALDARFESAAEAVAVEEDRLLGWRQVEGDYAENEGLFLLEPEGDGTRVRLVAEVELPFVLPRLATEAEVEHALSKSADDALFDLKALAER